MTEPVMNTVPQPITTGNDADPIASDRIRSRELALERCPSSPATEHSSSIVPETPHPTGWKRRHWRTVTWRFQFHFWRGVEMLLRIAVLRERPARSPLRGVVGQCAQVAPSEEPWRRQLSVGHGCSGPDLATPSINAISMGPRRHPTETAFAVCVVGSGEIASRLVERLLRLGIRVHATAETVEDYVAVRSAGAVPHRFEDMPAVASDIDLLISTSFSRFIGATVVARLPESTAIVDLAEAPGSVDFETSRRLGHEPIWVPSSSKTFEQSWGAIRSLVEKAVARRCK